jgi:hypothetical protein
MMSDINFDRMESRARFSLLSAVLLKGIHSTHLPIEAGSTEHGLTACFAEMQVWIHNRKMINIDYVARRLSLST